MLSQLAKWASSITVICGLTLGAYKSLNSVQETLSLLATKEDLVLLEERIDSKLNTLEGEDKALRIRAGYSYVREPVVDGHSIYLHFVAQRTKLGASCLFIDATPIFTDSLNIPQAGEGVGSGRQIGTSYVPLVLEAIPPSNLQEGIITVVIQFQYTCDDKPLIQNSEPFRYFLRKDNT